MIDLFHQVDEYCERIDFQLLSEPLNLYSNLLFWVAAGLALYEIWRSSVRRAGSLWCLLILLLLVGCGSALFHSYATQWAKICDVGFIGLFVVCFLWFWARSILHLALRYSVYFMLMFFGLSGLLYAIFLRLPVNGSQGYFGVALFLLALGVQQSWQLSKSQTLTRAACVFIASLVFRSLDEQLCSIWPYGTHFLWHSLNAVVCYLTIRGMREELEWQEGYRGLTGPR
ncbi:hypothetical protein [Oligoflexus tunisiensis]|uniref:hypothetical protein n=1 Tax=Oligoflexus tunisiensis TaxID=708132 RepID=UPI00114CC191|nr:hypothetical protein [Oligoflexus tunisiensis]